jgi:hypothetical protein
LASCGLAKVVEEIGVFQGLTGSAPLDRCGGSVVLADSVASCGGGLVEPISIDRPKCHTTIGCNRTRNYIAVALGLLLLVSAAAAQGNNNIVGVDVVETMTGQILSGANSAQIASTAKVIFYYIGSAEGHEYPDLQVGDEVNPRPFFGGNLRSNGKFFRSVGNATADTIKHYIKESQGKPKAELHSCRSRDQGN